MRLKPRKRKRQPSRRERKRLKLLDRINGIAREQIAPKVSELFGALSTDQSLFSLIKRRSQEEGNQTSDGPVAGGWYGYDDFE